MCKRIGDGGKASGQAVIFFCGWGHTWVVRLYWKPAGSQTSASPSSNKLTSCSLSCCDGNTLAWAPAQRGHYRSAPSAISLLTSIITLHRVPWLPSWQAGWLSIHLLVKDAPWSHISCCAAKDPPLLTPTFSNISWFSSRVGGGGSGAARLQWLAGLLRWSRAGYQSATTRKQTGQEKQSAGEFILRRY